MRPARGAPALGGGGLLLLVTMALTALPPRGQELLPLRQGEDYNLARPRLLSGGWRPHRLSEQEGCSVLPGDRRCSRFPELASCAHTGAGYCRFEWLAPDGRVYALITRDGDPEGRPGWIERWFRIH